MSPRTWILAHRWPSAAIGLTLVVALTGGGVLVAVAQPSPTPSPAAPSPSASPSPSPTPRPTPSPSPSPTPVAVRCPLSGLAVADPALLELTPLAVQVENNPVARPTRNLGNADMVIEATVEGDTTRFTAVVWCRATEGLTGPIRSARYYNVDLWQDLHVLTVGFGASIGSLDRFAAAGMPYVNGITGAWPWFTRYGPNRAPHNLYGDIEALRDAFGSRATLDRLAVRAGVLRPPFTFDEAAVLPAGRRVDELEIRTNRTWRIGWQWDVSLLAWRRLDGGVEQIDAATDQPLLAGHVIVQRVTEEVVYGDPDPAGNPRRLQHLVGHGDGTLYSHGMAIALRWSRPTATDATAWTYADSGDLVVLPPGVVWWEIIPIGASLTES